MTLNSLIRAVLRDVNLAKTAQDRRFDSDWGLQLLQPVLFRFQLVPLRYG